MSSFNFTMIEELDMDVIVWNWFEMSEALVIAQHFFNQGLKEYYQKI